MRRVALPGQPHRKLPAYSEYKLGDTMLKLYHERLPLVEIERQTDLLQRLTAAGLSVAAANTEIVQIANDTRHAQLSAMAPGTWLSEAYMRQPLKLRQYARLMAAEHLRIHQQAAISGLPSQFEILKSKILSAELDGAYKRASIALLQHLPKGGQVCHGDFQPYSVQLTESGARICNWKDACNGNPLADVARTALIMTQTVAEGGAYGLLLQSYLKLNNRFYLSAYFQQQQPQLAELNAWMIINAAARLAESVPRKQNLLRLIERKLPIALSQYGLPALT